MGSNKSNIAGDDFTGPEVREETVGCATLEAFPQAQHHQTAQSAVEEQRSETSSPTATPENLLEPRSPLKYDGHSLAASLQSDAVSPIFETDVNEQQRYGNTLKTVGIKYFLILFISLQLGVIAANMDAVKQIVFKNTKVISNMYSKVKLQLPQVFYQREFQELKNFISNLSYRARH